MVEGIWRLFIDDVASRKLRRQIRQRDRGDPRVETSDAMPHGKSPPSWFTAFVDELNNSPMFGD